jgi:tRNA dimethylallyltransferase
MITAGLVDEVRGLLERGYAPDLPSMSGLGYRQIVDYLQGKTSLEEAVRVLKRDTRRFVHHQYTWFRLNDPRIVWFDVSVDVTESIRQTARRFLEGGLQ